MDSTITLKTRNKAIIDDCEAAALRFRPVTNSDIRLLTGYFLNILPDHVIFQSGVFLCGPIISNTKFRKQWIHCFLWERTLPMVKRFSITRADL